MRQLFILIQKEFIQIYRDPLLPKLIFIFPVIVMLIMPWVTSMEVNNVNIAIIDEDQSTLSHRMTSDIRATKYFTINDEATTYDVAHTLLDDCEVDIILFIPKNFEQDITSAEPQALDISANAVNATKGTLGSQYLAQTIGSTLSKYMDEQGVKQLSDLVTIQHRYNPTLNYRYLMIPALMIILLIMICGFLSAINIVSEKENGTIEQINVTPVGKFTFVLAKLIPFWLIGLFVISIAMIIAWWIYGLVPVGSLGNIYLASILFILGFSGFGVTVANLSENILQTMFVMFFFIMVSMLLSGLLTPISSMPEWAQHLTVILPPRYYIEIMRSVYLKGSTFMELWHNFAALGVFVIVFNVLAAVTYKKQA
ncbi:MAG: ABC transporter permease [Bacteroidaceae bacterium]|nr:ABC transporter permease [Bacteroidaceae bacterium]